MSSNAPPKPKNLWSSPANLPASPQTDRLTQVLSNSNVSAAQVAEKRKAAQKRVMAFRTPVSASTLASPLD